MKIVVVIIITAIVGLMALSVGLLSAQEPNTISGMVTDATTGEPIDAARVSLEDTDPAFSARTDASGAYQISGVSTGEHAVTASADGYESETIDAEVTESEGASVDFSLQPSETDEEDAGEKAEDEEADEEPEGEAEDGKKAGDRHGYVGTFTPGDGAFTLTRKRDEVVIQIPEEGIESITRMPGEANATGRPEDGVQVAVLVEFVDIGNGELIKVARQVIVKPFPLPPVTGAVVSVDTDADGVRVLTIMRPDGTTKAVQLGREVDPPEVGELVTAFHGVGWQ